MDLNAITIIGRLTRDVELTYTPNGMAVGKFPIACNRMKQKDNSVPVDYFDITLFGKQAENLKPYLIKGKQIAVGGRLQQDRWQGKDGKNQSRVYIVANNVQLIGGAKTDSQSPSNQGQQYQQSYNQQDSFPDDIPF